MLKEKEIKEKINKIEHKIRALKNRSDIEYIKEYIEHLENLKVAYKKEQIKSLIRKDEEEIDELDYISHFFPRNGRII